MTTSALVLTLEQDATRCSAALRQLRDHPGVSLGQACGRRLPLVLEAQTAEAGERVTRELADLPGVARLEILFVGFSEAEPTAPHTTSEATERTP